MANRMPYKIPAYVRDFSKLNFCCQLLHESVVRKLFLAENAITGKFFLKVPKMSACSETEGTESVKETDTIF